MKAPAVICRALLQAGIRAWPVAEHRGPGQTLYRLALPPALMPAALRQRATLAAALDAPGLTTSQRGAYLEVCVPTQRQTVGLEAIGPALGVTASGHRVNVSLDRYSPHAIVGGQTGSGKSELLRTLAVLESRQPDTRLLLIDLKASGMWDAMEALGHTVVTSDPLSALTWAAARIGSGHPGRTVIIIDEAARLDARSQALALEIAERGRADGLRLVLATQYIRADVLNRRITTAADWRIAGRVFDATASRLILGQPGAEFLAGRGDMLISNGGAPARRFQAALAGDAATDRAMPTERLTLPSLPATEAASGALAWAAATGASARAIRTRYGIGQDKARAIRDEAAAMTDRGAAIIRPDFGVSHRAESVSHPREGQYA